MPGPGLMHSFVSSDPTSMHATHAIFGTFLPCVCASILAAACTANAHACACVCKRALRRLPHTFAYGSVPWPLAARRETTLHHVCCPASSLLCLQMGDHLFGADEPTRQPRVSHPSVRWPQAVATTAVYCMGQARVHTCGQARPCLLHGYTAGMRSTYLCIHPGTGSMQTNMPAHCSLEFYIRLMLQSGTQPCSQVQGVSERTHGPISTKRHAVALWGSSRPRRCKEVWLAGRHASSSNAAAAGVRTHARRSVNCVPRALNRDRGAARLQSCW